MILLMLGILFPTLSAVDTSPSIGGGSVAQAAICKERYATWDLKGSDISTWPTVAKAKFGALICVEAGRITSVSPFQTINRTSTGVSAGFTWDNNGARVTRLTSTYVEVTGTATSRVCYGISKFQLCSLTTSETYRMRYYSVYGPYPTSAQPGIIGVYKWCSLTGCTSGNLVKRTSTYFPFI
jgi:hypothetical protein